MRIRTSIFVTVVGLAVGFALAAVVTTAVATAATPKTSDAKDADKGKETASASAPAAGDPMQDDSLRVEGEKRYHSNCGRCHAAPPKFSPRMMATILRHMRVRSTITDEDMRLILHYMTQ